MSNLFLLIDPDRQGLRSAELYGVEIHGVKLLFRWKRTHAVEVPHANRSCGEAPAKAREGAGGKQQVHAKLACAHGEADEAAVQVLLYLGADGHTTADPRQKPEEEGHGHSGRRQKARRQQPRQPSLSTPLTEWPTQPLTPATLAAMGVYTAPCFEGEAPGACAL